MMRSLIGKAMVGSLVLMMAAPAFADDLMRRDLVGLTGQTSKDESNNRTNELGVEIHGGSGNTIYQASLTGARSNDPFAKQNGANFSGQISTDWSSGYYNNGTGRTVIGTDHSVIQTNETLRFAPMGVGFLRQNGDGSTRLGGFVEGWQLEKDNRLGAQGSSAGVHLLADINFHNVALLSANLRAGMTYGMKGDVQTGTTSSSSVVCNNGSASGYQQCQTVDTTTTYETHPGFKQVGTGSYLQGDLSSYFRVGENGYVKLSAIYEKQDKKGVLTHYVTGEDTSVSSVHSSSLGVGAAVGMAF